MQAFKWVLGFLGAVLLAACGGGSHQVIGTVSGTGGGTVQLRLFGNDSFQDATVTGDGSYAFPQAVSGEYFVLVDSDPVGIACTTLNSEGEATPLYAETVSCARTAFTIGGTITSDPDVGDVLVELRNTVNGESIVLANSGDFTFTQPVAADGNYNVAIASQTAGFACSVANGSGTAGDDVIDIAVTCGPAPVALAQSPFAPTSAGIETTGFPPAGLKAVFSGQFIRVTWDADTRSTFRLFEDKDGSGPGASVHINDAYARLNGTQPIGNRDWTILVDPAQLLFTHNRARYSVQSCFNNVCSRVSEQVRVDFSQIPNLVGALDNALVVGTQLFHQREKELRDTVALRDAMERNVNRRDSREIRAIDEANSKITHQLLLRRQAQRMTRGIWDLRNQFPGACSLDFCYSFLLNSI